MNADWAGFREQDPQYNNCITIPLPNASSDTRLMVRATLFGLKGIYRAGYTYKKAGVMLTGIARAAVRQGVGKICRPALHTTKWRDVPVAHAYRPYWTLGDYFS